VGKTLASIPKEEPPAQLIDTQVSVAQTPVSMPSFQAGVQSEPEAVLKAPEGEKPHPEPEPQAIDSQVESVPQSIEVQAQPEPVSEVPVESEPPKEVEVNEPVVSEGKPVTTESEISPLVVPIPEQEIALEKVPITSEPLAETKPEEPKVEEPVISETKPAEPVNLVSEDAPKTEPEPVSDTPTEIKPDPSQVFPDPLPSDILSSPRSEKTSIDSIFSEPGDFFGKPDFDFSEISANKPSLKEDKKQKDLFSFGDEDEEDEIFPAVTKKKPLMLPRIWERIFLELKILMSLIHFSMWLPNLWLLNLRNLRKQRMIFLDQQLGLIRKVNKKKWYLLNQLKLVLLLNLCLFKQLSQLKLNLNRKNLYKMK